MAAIGVGIGRGGRAQQSQAQQVAHRVVAVLRIVDEAEAVLRVAEVGPAQRRHFEARLFPAVVARGRPLDGSVGNLVGRESALMRPRETQP